MQIHHCSASPSVGLALVFTPALASRTILCFCLTWTKPTPISSSSAAVSLVCLAVTCVSFQSLCRLCLLDFHCVAWWLWSCCSGHLTWDLTSSMAPFSRKDAANFQHRDEEQDEGSYHDRRRDFLEVDLAQHSGPGYGQRRLPLEHGGRLSASQSLRPPLQPGRLPDHQLPHRRQAEVAAAHWHFSTGRQAAPCSSGLLLLVFCNIVQYSIIFFLVFQCMFLPLTLSPRQTWPVLCSSAKPRCRSHAALLSGQEGVSTHWGTRRRVRTVQDGGKHRRVDSVLLCSPRTSRRKSKIHSITGGSVISHVRLGRCRAKLNVLWQRCVRLSLVVLPLAAHHWSGNSAHRKPAIPQKSRGCFLSSGSPEWLSSGHAGRNTGDNTGATT